MASAATGSPASLHDLAITAESSLEKLATGLAEAGAGEETVKAVSQMADVTRKIASALGQGQESTGDEEAPEGEAPSGGADDQQPRSFDEASRQMMAERKQ